MLGSLTVRWCVAGARALRMATILVVIIAILLVGTGGGFYGYRQYGGPGLGGAIVFVVLIILVLWLAGGFHG